MSNQIDRKESGILVPAPRNTPKNHLLIGRCSEECSKTWSSSLEIWVEKILQGSHPQKRPKESRKPSDSSSQKKCQHPTQVMLETPWLHRKVYIELKLNFCCTVAAAGSKHADLWLDGDVSRCVHIAYSTKRFSLPSLCQNDGRTRCEKPHSLCFCNLLQDLLYIQIRFQIRILLSQCSCIFPPWNHGDLCCATTSTWSSSVIWSGWDASVRFLIGLRCCNARHAGLAQHDAQSTKSKMHDSHSGPAWCPSVAGEFNLTNSCFKMVSVASGTYSNLMRKDSLCRPKNGLFIIGQTGLPRKQSYNLCVLLGSWAVGSWGIQPKQPPPVLETMWQGSPEHATNLWISVWVAS